jgi:hypothetical protein
MHTHRSLRAFVEAQLHVPSIVLFNVLPIPVRRGKSSWPAVQHAPAGASGPPCASSSEAASKLKSSILGFLGWVCVGSSAFGPASTAATSQPEHPTSEQPRARRVLYLGKRHHRGQRGPLGGPAARPGLWRDAHFGPGPGPSGNAPGAANPPRPARARPGRCGPWRGIMIGPRGLQRPRQLEAALPPSDPSRPDCAHNNESSGCQSPDSSRRIEFDFSDMAERDGAVCLPTVMSLFK